jgi:hypothetical protein
VQTFSSWLRSVILARVVDENAGSSETRAWEKFHCSTRACVDVFLAVSAAQQEQRIHHTTFEIVAMCSEIRVATRFCLLSRDDTVLWTGWDGEPCIVVREGIKQRYTAAPQEVAHSLAQFLRAPAAGAAARAANDEALIGGYASGCAATAPLW